MKPAAILRARARALKAQETAKADAARTENDAAYERGDRLIWNADRTGATMRSHSKAGRYIPREVRALLAGPWGEPAWQ